MIRSLSSYISSSDSRRPNLLNKIPFFCMGFAVFLVSNVKRIEVRSFGEHIASRLEARKPTYQCELRPQDLRLWDGTDNVINRDQLHDRICGHKMVSCSRVAPQLFRLHGCDRCMVGRVHLHGAPYP